MTKWPNTSQQAGRGRNPGKAIFVHRERNPERSALSRQIDPEKDFQNIPWQMIHYSTAEAKARKLTTLVRFGEVLGYHPETPNQWKQRHKDFPEPKGIHSQPHLSSSGAHLYSIVELLKWWEQKVKERKVYAKKTRA